MNPTLNVFGLTIPIFSLSLFGAALIGTAWAARRTGWSPGRTIDLALAVAAGALIGGRVEHVALHWAEWFSAHPQEILRLNLGGLGWHGALIGGLAGFALGCSLLGRRTPSPPSESRHGSSPLPPPRERGTRGEGLSVLAPVLALLTLGGWIGCAAAVCAWGKEVTTLADYPAWAVGWTRDVYNLYAPRYNTQLYGAALAIGLLIISLWKPAQSVGRFWLVLALLGAGMALIGFWRADPVPVVFGLRADQVADMVVAAWAAALYVYSRRRPRRLRGLVTQGG